MKKSILFCWELLNTFSTNHAYQKHHDPIVGGVVNYNTITGTVNNSATGANTTFSNGSLTQEPLHKLPIPYLPPLK
jgi:hypothetical protein